MEIITSPDNRKIKTYSALKQKKYRDQSGLFLVQNRHMIEEAIQADALFELIVRQGVENIFDREATYVSDNVMRKLSDNVSLNDYLAVCRMKSQNVSGDRIIVLDRVQDPGNVGTIIRTAYAFDFQGVILNQGCADVYNEKTLQASQGAVFHCPMLRLGEEDVLDYLKENDYHIIATDVHNSFELKDLTCPERYALIFGNEGQGVCADYLAQSDQRVHIEMDRFESLNVAIAAGICMYECRYGK